MKVNLSWQIRRIFAPLAAVEASSGKLFFLPGNTTCMWESEVLDLYLLVK